MKNSILGNEPEFNPTPTTRITDPQVKEEPKEQPRQFRQGGLSGKLFGKGGLGNSSELMNSIHIAFTKVADEYNSSNPTLGIQFHMLKFDDSTKDIPAEIIIMKESDGRLFIVPLLICSLLRGTIPDYKESAWSTETIPQTEESLWPGQMASDAKLLIASKMFPNRTFKSVEELNDNIIVAGYMKLPKDTGVTYVTPEECKIPFYHAIYTLIDFSLLNKRLPTALFNYTTINREQFTLGMEVRIIPNGVALDTLGQPKSANVELLLVAKTKGNIGRVQFHQTNVSRPLVKTMVQIDFLPQCSIDDVNRIRGGVPVNPVAVPMFIVRETTSICGTEFETDSILTQLLGLAMVKIYSENNRWTHVFDPTVNPRGYNDIGLLGLMGDPHRRNDNLTVKQIVPKGAFGAAGTDVYSLSDFVNEYASTHSIIAIDIQRGGPLEGIQSLIFSNSESTDVIRQQAIDIGVELTAFCADYDLASEQTPSNDSGKFLDYWQENGGLQKVPVLDPDSMTNGTVHQYEGVYRAPDNSLRDIRDISLLACLFTPGATIDSIGVQEYLMTRIPNTDSVRDLYKQYNFFIAEAGMLSMTITGKSERFFINPNFLGMMNSFLQLNGIRIDVDDTQLTETNRFGFQRDTVVNQNYNFHNVRSASPRGGASSGQFERGFDRFNNHRRG